MSIRGRAGWKLKVKYLIDQQRSSAVGGRQRLSCFAIGEFEALQQPVRQL